MSRLRNRVALVTGSSRGIGAAIAKLFAHEGAKVALHGRDAAALSEVRAEIEWSGGCASAKRRSTHSGCIFPLTPATRPIAISARR
jgi:NAD(P)-dependent dehydrogenase (short-subunit alcohol dehydrogenase family)